MKILILTAAVILSGCAAHSGVVPLGKDTYMVSRQAATGFTGLSTLKSEALIEAGQHCASINKQLQVVSTSENKPPFILGNYPRAEVNFMCLAENDKDLQRPVLQNAPDRVLEVRNR